MNLRKMMFEDIEDVISIEVASYGFPWGEKTFRDCIFLGYPSYVVEYVGKIVGYVIVAHGRRSSHILNLCVSPKHRKQGWGRGLLQSSCREAECLGSSCIFLEVRSSNAGAKSLYESEFFRVISVKKDYYPARHGREDALVYFKVLGHFGNLVTS